MELLLNSNIYKRIDGLMVKAADIKLEGFAFDPTLNFGIYVTRDMFSAPRKGQLSSECGV